MQDGRFKGGIFSAKFVVLALLAVALIVGGIVYRNYQHGVEQRPETSGAHFMELLTQKDGSQTYAMFNDHAKKQLSEGEWNTWVVYVFQDYSGGQPKLQKKDSVPDPSHLYSKNDQAVRLRYELKTKGGTGLFELVLVQDGESWKVADTGLVK